MCRFVILNLLLACALYSEPLAKNVVLITFDDLRQDTAGFNGGPARTPNMDRLASISTNFRNATTTVGLCSPSRATLFTGRYGHQTGLDDNVNVWHSRLTALSAAVFRLTSTKPRTRWLRAIARSRSPSPNISLAVGSNGRQPRLSFAALFSA